MNLDSSLTQHDQWSYLAQFLPSEEALDASAVEHKAIQRRRIIRNGTQLLRLCMVWAACGYSLERTAAWAEALYGVPISDVALLKRFRNCERWLAYLVSLKLHERHPARLPPELAARSVSLIDATVITEPGSTGTDWRLHLRYDLAQCRILDAQLSDARGAESLQRWELGEGELVLGDKAYGHRQQLAYATSRGADVIARMNWSSTPLEQRDGRPFDLIEALRAVPDATPVALPLRTRPQPREGLEAVAVWLVALRLDPEQAEQARQRVRRRYKAKDRHRIDPRTLETAGYILLLTTLEAEKLGPENILELYRFRWQIECCNKRLKSLLHFDRLPASTDELAQTWLLTQLYIALLVDDISQASDLAFSPWGFPLRRRRLRGELLACDGAAERPGPSGDCQCRDAV